MRNARMPNYPQKQAVINLFRRLTESDNFHSVDAMLEANVLLAIMPDKNGTMPLEIAILEGDESVIGLIKDALSKIEKQWPEIMPKNINEIGSDKYTPLTLAIENNDLKKVELLLALGADPNKQDGYGMSPIIAAYPISEQYPRAKDIYELIMKHDKFSPTEDDILMMDVVNEELQKSAPIPTQIKEENTSATAHKAEEIDVTAKMQKAQKSTEVKNTVLPDAKIAKKVNAQKIQLSLKAAKEALDIDDVKFQEPTSNEEKMSGEELMEKYKLFDKDDMTNDPPKDSLEENLVNKNLNEMDGNELLKEYGLNDTEQDSVEENLVNKNLDEMDGNELLEEYGLFDDPVAKQLPPVRLAVGPDPVAEKLPPVRLAVGTDPVAKKLPPVRTSIRAEINASIPDPATDKSVAKRPQRERGPLLAPSMPGVSPAQNRSAINNSVRNDSTAREEISHDSDKPRNRY
jgi:hypothetical protein